MTFLVCLYSLILLGSFCNNALAAPKATSICYANQSCQSVLASHPPREFILADKNHKEAFFQLRSDILKQVLIEDGDVAAAIIHYDPSVYDHQDEILKTLHVDGKADSYSRAVAWRHQTKHRDVTSEVTCYGNGFGERVSGFPMVVTTGVGYNFMGSSPSDEFLYVTNGKLKSREAYQHAMTLLFKRWLRSMDDAHVEVAIIPMISGGVYVKKLSRSERAVARELIQKALMTALASSDFNSLQEVIHVNPNDRAHVLSGMYKTGQRVFSQYQGTTSLTLTNADFFEAAEKANVAGYRVGMLNPGSDRTLGGKFMHFLTVPENGNYTLEEIIFNLTDIYRTQSLDYLRKPYRYQTYPRSLQVNTDKTMPCTAQDKQDRFDNKRLAMQLQTRLLTEAVQVQNRNQNDKQISFKTQAQAQRFVDMLSAQGMNKKLSKVNRRYAVQLNTQDVQQLDICQTQ